MWPFSEPETKIQSTIHEYDQATGNIMKYVAYIVSKYVPYEGEYLVYNNVSDKGWYEARVLRVIHNINRLSHDIDFVSLLVTDVRPYTGLRI